MGRPHLDDSDGEGSAALGVLGAVLAGEFSLTGLREQLAGQLEGPVLLFIQVVANLDRQLLGTLGEVVGGGVDPTQFLDQLLGLVMVGQRVATDVEASVVQQQRNVQVTLLRSRVRVQFVGECEKCSTSLVGRCARMRHRARQRPLNLVALPKILEDGHGPAIPARGPDET